MRSSLLSNFFNIFCVANLPANTPTNCRNWLIWTLTHFISIENTPWKACAKINVLYFSNHLEVYQSWFNRKTAASVRYRKRDRERKRRAIDCCIWDNLLLRFFEEKKNTSVNISMSWRWHSDYVEFFFFLLRS